MVLQCDWRDLYKVEYSLPDLFRAGCREAALLLKSSGMAVDYLQTTGLFKPCEIYTAQEFMNIFKAGADQLNCEGYLIEEIRSAGFII